jgi:hypothetical protein
MIACFRAQTTNVMAEDRELPEDEENAAWDPRQAYSDESAGESSEESPDDRPQAARNRPAASKQQPGDSASKKLFSTGGLLASILLSLLFGLSYVVRSLKNVNLTLFLKLKRDDRAEKKY